jgi:hypothetical protein
MRIRRVAFVTTALFLAPIISISPTNADVRSPSPVALSKSDLNAIYKEALNKYLSDIKIYENMRREINKIFKDAIDRAVADSKASNSLAVSQVQKSQSMKLKQSAIIAATEVRDSAIAALGEPPVAPTPPAKSSPTDKNNKQQPQISPKAKR